jgi:translocation and assembly module TamB
VQAQWRFGGLVAEAPLGLQLDASGLAQGERRLQRLQARLDGTLAAHRLSLQAESPLQPPAWAGAAPGGSRLALEANSRWQPEPSGSRWQGTLQQLRAAPRQGGGTPWLQAQDVGLDTRLDTAGRPVQAALAPGRLTLLDAGVRWTTARWQAAQGGRPQQARLQAELEPLTVAPLLAALQPQFGWRGDLAIGGRADITLAETLNADVQLSRRSGDLGLRVDGRPLDFGLQTLQVGARADGGRWQLAQTLVSARLGRIDGRQVLTGAPGDLAPGGDARLEGRLQLDLPALAAFSPWVPAGWRVDGRLAADVGLGGTLASPDLRGEVSGRDLAVRNLFQGVNLRDGRLQVRLDGQRVQVAESVFRSEGDGLLRLDGEATLSPQPQGRLRVVAERFRALDRVDRRVTVSGSATVALAQQLSVDGRFTLDEGRIDISQSDAPALDDDIVVLNREGAVAPKAPGGTAPPGLALRVAVNLGEQLRLTGRGLDARLGGELDVTTPNGLLAVNGVVRILEGTYTAYGQNLSVARGNVVFTGDAANPRLDIFAIRPDIDQRVGITVSGNAVNPRVRLTSEPELPEIDKLTWLVLGRAPEGLGRADTALLQRAALALVAGDKGGKGGGVAEKVGLDKLTLRGGSAAEGGGAVIGLGKQLSKRLFFGYEHALASAGGYWQIVYRAAGRLTLRARTGLDNAIDAVWTWRWE